MHVAWVRCMFAYTRSFVSDRGSELQLVQSWVGFTGDDLSFERILFYPY